MRALALDVGTSFVKAAVLDVERGEPVGAVGRSALVLDHPFPGAAELPLDRLWDAIGAAVAACGPALESVEGVGLSCMMPTLVLVDKEDRPLGPAWTHLDRRGALEARAIRDEVGTELHASTGNLPLPGGISAVTYRALARREPALPGRVRRYLHLNGWLGGRLTGRYAFDPANAAFSGLLDTLGTGDWSPRWTRYYGVEGRWLPPIVSGETTLGPLTKTAAAAWRLPPGVPVKIGTADTTSALLAAGAVPGDLLHVAGTTQVLAAPVAVPVPGPRRLVRPLGVGHGFVHVTHNPLGGAALEWLRKLCFADTSAEGFYEDAVAAALVRETEVRLDPPFLGGDRLELEPKAAAFRELTLGTERLELLSAVLSAMRTGHAEALRELGAGTSFERVFLTGGAAPVVRRVLGLGAVGRIEEGSLLGVARLFR